MGTRLSDSPLYAHLWGTPEMADLFAEERRLQSWLDILVALAGAQAKLGIVPPSAAAEIASLARVELLDLDLVAEETRRTSHSTLGLIHGLERVLGEETARHVYLGATVQDVTDTWFGLVMRDAGALVWRDLRAVEATLLALASRHRDTVLAGRTHGQPGSPTTFGLKAASWADEIRRHVDRLREGRPRWVVGQLAGAVGTLAFFGPAGPDLRAAFCAELSLADPGISWLTARDRVAEFAHVLAMITATLARIGGEIYELQRPEIGELREPAVAGGVGSITMPHKRNPEAAEHLGTLALLARSSAGVLLETMVQQHERDGRGWKAEWIALPEVCLLAGAALSMARSVTAGLEVDATAMAANLHAHGGVPGSEQVLAHLSARLGKHAAQRLLHSLLRDEAGPDLATALAAQGVATVDEVRGWLADPAVAVAGVMVDHVVERARQARMTEEAEPW